MGTGDGRRTADGTEGGGVARLALHCWGSYDAVPDGGGAPEIGKFDLVYAAESDGEAPAVRVSGARVDVTQDGCRVSVTIDLPAGCPPS